MKKIFVPGVLIFALVLTVGAVVAQTGLPGSGWWSGEMIQNVGTSDTEISIIAYDKNSTATFSDSVIRSPGESYNFVPGDFTGMPDGFEGSAVVSADQPIKAVVNVTNRQAGSLGVSGGKAAAQYQGLENVADVVYFPIAKGNSFNKTTTFYIQNANQTQSTTATATFRMKNGDVHTYTTPSIQPNRMVVFSIFDTSTYDPDAVDNTGRVGAVKVEANTSGVGLAGIVMEHYTAETPASLAQSTRGFTESDFDTEAYAPITKNTRFSRSTGIQVQNVSEVAIDVRVDYLGFAGACAGNSYFETASGVQPGASAIFNQMPGQTVLPGDCTASATISTSTSNGKLAALVSESYYATMIPPTGQRSVTSFAIPASKATTKLSVPLFKDDRFDKRTGLQIQNVGSVQANNIVATFKCVGGATFTAISLPQSASAGGAVQFYTPSNDPIFTSSNPFSSNNVVCGVTVTADQPIVAIANESPIPGGTFEQDNNNYEGFNLTP